MSPGCGWLATEARRTAATSRISAKSSTSTAASLGDISISLECPSALARLEREGALASDDATEAFRRLDQLAGSWFEVQPHDEIREVARRLLRVHALRAADALQLAAAYVVSERRPPTLAVATLDDRVRQAGLKEGFVLRRMKRSQGQ